MNYPMTEVQFAYYCNLVESKSEGPYWGSGAEYYLVQYLPLYLVINQIVQYQAPPSGDPALELVAIFHLFWNDKDSAVHFKEAGPRDRLLAKGLPAIHQFEETLGTDFSGEMGLSLLLEMP